MRCRAELHAAHRALAHRVEAQPTVAAIDTLAADTTPSGDVETELVLRADRVPAYICGAVGDAQLAIASVRRQGPDHTVVMVR